MSRKIDKIEVETPATELEETTVVEAITELPTVEAREAPPEGMETPTPVSALDSVKSLLHKLVVDELKEVMGCCEDLITELQREQVEELESQMRFIQDQLIALKGPRYSPAPTSSRNVKPLVNPSNPNEVYTTGMLPGWLKELIGKTGKPVWQLREESPNLRVGG